jgi:hypothetical protein
MIQIRNSDSTRANQDLTGESTPQESPKVRADDAAAPRREPGNVAWVKSVWEKMNEPDKVAILLFGGVKGSHLRLRQAQSHLRHDFSPSHWSHAMIAGGPGLKQAWEVPTIAGRLPWPTSDNGLAKAKLDDYDPLTQFPNAALLCIPVAWKEIEARIKQLRDHGRVGLMDLVSPLHAWLGFLWGVGKATNPLVDGVGMPSAIAVEVILAAADYEITPNVSSETSCPEAIWQSAKWWQDWHQRDERTGIKGAYRIRDGIRP